MKLLIFSTLIIGILFVVIVVLLLLIRRKNKYIYENDRFHKSQTNQYNKKIKKIEVELEEEKQKSNHLQNKLNSINCIVCGEKSNGKQFCFSCYSKYKKRTFDLRIENLKGSNIVDEWGNKTEICEDGRRVRSRAEQCIANFFYNNKIRYAYEKPINFKGNILRPDFYLPDYDLYIEYNEIKDEEYTKKKDFAMQIYKQLNKRVIIMTKEDRENIYEYFCKLLNT